MCWSVVPDKNRTILLTLDNVVVRILKILKREKA